MHIVDQRLFALRARAALTSEYFALALLRAELEQWRYNPDQPRVPAGQTGGGQWSGRESTGAGGDYDLAGGFSRDDEAMSVADFAPRNCAGSTRRELPGQFLDMTITDVMQMAKQGDAAARKCLKLLGRDRFRK